MRFEDLDPLLMLAADNETAAVTIADPDLDWLYHPYDGGADAYCSVAKTSPAATRATPRLAAAGVRELIDRKVPGLSWRRCSGTSRVRGYLAFVLTRLPLLWLPAASSAASRYE
jgi:hypothetical protein